MSIPFLPCGVDTKYISVPVFATHVSDATANIPAGNKLLVLGATSCSELPKKPYTPIPWLVIGLCVASLVVTLLFAVPNNILAPAVLNSPVTLLVGS